MLGLRLTWVVVAALLLVPAAARAADTEVRVSAGDGHTCALLSPSGRVACWGGGSLGQIGVGPDRSSAVPVTVKGIGRATSVSAGPSHSCAVLQGDDVACWGRYSNEEIVLDLATPTRIAGTSGAIAVSAGGDHDCALFANGGVRCWGADGDGQLGNGQPNATGEGAVDVAGIDSAVAVSAGSNHSCAVLSSGEVRCWGYAAPSGARLGGGFYDDFSDSPLAVADLTSATAVSAGERHTCAIVAGGTVACWGDSLGPRPVAVPGIAGAVAISAGGEGRTCALLAAGAITCWDVGTAPSPVALDPMTGVSVGGGHTCASGPGPRVVCWGRGDAGQLGDGRSKSSATPVTVRLQLVSPEFGRTTVAAPVSGTVKIKRPGARRYVTLRAESSLPLGTSFDTTAGIVQLTAAADAAGTTRSGQFRAGVFRTGERQGLTVLTLTEPLSCSASASLATTKPKKKRKKKRSLWGDATGDFQTAGRHGSATVRGTEWETVDTCTDTTVRVKSGSVRVTNSATGSETVVTAGGSVTVRPGEGKATERGFATGVSGLLTRFASGRKTLATAIGGALDCSLPASTAARRVGDVIDNRTSIRDAAARLRVPTREARTIRARLLAAVAHSLAADRHYRDWLAGVAGAACPLPRTAAFTAAGRDDARATDAKQDLVAAYNPLARKLRLRTWRASEL